MRRSLGRSLHSFPAAYWNVDWPIAVDVGWPELVINIKSLIFKRIILVVIAVVDTGILER